MTRNQLTLLRILLKEDRQMWEQNSNPKQTLVKRLGLQINAETTKEIQKLLDA